MTQFFGYAGLFAFALAWVPQSLETLRAGRCGASRAFVALSAFGSLSLALYAWENGDLVFSAVNALTTLGALLNLYYSLCPRPASLGLPDRRHS